MTKDGDAQAVWARVLLGSLADAGVTDVVISPGSRSTPLVLAAHRLATLHCHDVIDERAAAFFALGQAKVTGRPTLLVCTSGSAGAHYLPALLEARQSFVPLLVLTADRPVSLAQCGANQTVDQVKLYGDQVVGFFDLGAACLRPDALRALRRTASQAVDQSLGPTPGGVHLNARLHKPLEPESGMADADARADEVRGLAVWRATRPSRCPPDETLDRIAETLRAAERPVVVAGPAPLDRADRAAVCALAARAGAPLFAETTSQVRLGPLAEGCLRVDAFDLLVGAGCLRLGAPDAVVQVGATPTSGAWGRYLEAAVAGGCRHVVLAEHGWPDARSTASAMAVGAVAASVAGLTRRLDPRAPIGERWLDRWAEAERIAWRQVDDILDRQGRDPGSLSEGMAVRLAVASIPANGLLALGNSLPVRLADTWAPGAVAEPSVRVWHQRGTSGIDGLVSGAAGAALASGAPTLLVLGDVSLLHDLGGLALAARLDTPFVILVIENGGGRIFDLLPIVGHPDAADALDHWHTPHGTRFGHAAAAFDLPFERADASVSVRAALEHAWETPGATVVEATVPPDGAAADTMALRRAVRAAL